MKEHNLLNTDNLLYKIQVLDKYYVKFYSHCTLKVQITDSHMVTHDHAHAFKAVDLSGYDLILDYSWLQVINPDVDWVTKEWKYYDTNKIKLIEILDIEVCANEIQKNCTVFVLISYYIITDEFVTLFRSAVNKSCLSAYLKEFADIFSEKKIMALSDHAQVKHVIKLKLSKQLLHKLIYSLSKTELKILHEYLKFSLEKK